VALLDDVRAARAKVDQAQTDADTTLAAAVTVLVNRLRPVAALSWISDPVLTDACGAFLEVAIQGATQADPARPERTRGRGIVD
jgi:hypothetical protein